MKKNELYNNFFITICPDCRSFVSDIKADRRAVHEEIEIKCFYSGTTTLMVGDKTINVKAGDIVVINPYEFHTTINRGADNDNGLYHLFMVPLDVLSGRGLDDLKLRTLLLENNNSLKTLYQNDKRLYKILMRIVKEYSEKNTAYDIAIGGLVMELFAVLIRKGLQESDSKSGGRENLRAYRLIEPALRCIRDNYQEQISVENLSKMCNLSKSYFCRVFKSVTGKTAMEYLSEYRLKLADAMLCDSNNTIAYVAESCGFESFSYFCRSYKKYYGIKPSDRR